MSVKLTGAQYAAWMNSWGANGETWDEEIVLINGVLKEDVAGFSEKNLTPTDIVEVREGYIELYPGHDPVDALTHIRRWLKAQTTVSLSIEIPKTDIDAFKALVKVKFPKAKMSG